MVQNKMLEPAEPAEAAMEANPVLLERQTQVAVEVVLILPEPLQAQTAAQVSSSSNTVNR